MPRNKRTGNLIGDFRDAADRVLLWKGNHAHTKPYVIYIRVGVIDKYKISVPVDCSVVGASVFHGEVYLRIQVIPSKHDILIDRFFYVLDHDNVMRYPNLGYITDLKIGGKMWIVLEDDMTT
jgi:hypothetical protein